jgi:hypothetical protein
MNALKIFGVAVLISAAVAAAPQAQEHPLKLKMISLDP